jgi:hypothetical protein
LKREKVAMERVFLLLLWQKYDRNDNLEKSTSECKIYEELKIQTSHSEQKRNRLVHPPFRKQAYHQVFTEKASVVSIQMGKFILICQG